MGGNNIIAFYDTVFQVSVMLGWEVKVFMLVLKKSVTQQPHYCIVLEVG